MRQVALIVALSVAVMAAGQPAVAQELPTIPEPVPVTVDPSTTALLVLDIVSATCPSRPTCVESVPAVADLLAAARDAGALVVHSNVTAPGSMPMPEVTPLPDEPSVTSSADKFFRTDLEDILRQHGIQTVIIVGTAANGAVLYTTFGSNARGFTVVVAEDGIAGTTPFDTFLTRYQVLNQPGPSNPENEPLREGRTTLSRTDLITFR